MNYSILNKFLDKRVEIFVHGQSHVGTLARTEELDVTDHFLETLVLKYDIDDFKSQIYDDLYVDTRSIDAIREVLEQAKRLRVEPTPNGGIDVSYLPVHKEV